jgi:hypothetical protein
VSTIQVWHASHWLIMYLGRNIALHIVALTQAESVTAVAPLTTCHRIPPNTVCALNTLPFSSALSTWSKKRQKPNGCACTCYHSAAECTVPRAQRKETVSGRCCAVWRANNRVRAFFSRPAVPLRWCADWFSSISIGEVLVYLTLIILPKACCCLLRRLLDSNPCIDVHVFIPAWRHVAR